MKKSYEEPKMKVIEFECADIITSSGDVDEGPKEGPIL